MAATQKAKVKIPERKNKLVLILGAFNPPTMAHVEMGKLAQDVVPDADIIYVPANDEAVRLKAGGNFTIMDITRSSLFENALSEHGFKISNIEITGKSNGREIDTVAYFKKNGYEEIYLCIGYDVLEEMKDWYKADLLIRNIKVLVVSRNGKELDECKDPFIQKYRKQFIAIKNTPEYEEVSSSKVRTAFSVNKLDLMEDVVPPMFFRYLKVKREAGNRF